MRKAGFKTVTGLLCLTVITGSLCSGCKNSQEKLEAFRKIQIPLQDKKNREVKVELMSAY
ncbi:hypothetical protein BBI00_10320 [Chryseobacterium arthrosphaerae]|uniref:Uncharacterized protein n=1 Tax=Chryseobacterium arthrosphaerae TaxID=651561 RepID=A0A1B8ZSY5_9FLAO|nr:hypothetical protein BBI00_10320 [Chryseobacterium arthrosphaerae]